MSDEVGSGRSDWARLERRHRVAVIVFATALVLVAGAVGAAWWGASRTVSGQDAPVVVDPLPPETPIVQPATPSVTTASTGTSAASTLSADPAARLTVPAGRAALVAFRVQGALVVAGEDGTGETTVLKDAPAIYSLSPDGRTVAALDAERGELILVDVASRKVKRVPDAVPAAAPSWAPDSSRVYFTAGKSAVHARRVRRDGSGSEQVAAEVISPQVSPDGKRVAYLFPKGPGGNLLLVRRLSETAAVRVAEGIAEFTWADAAGLYYSTIPRLRPSEIHGVAADRSQDRMLDGYAGARPASFTDLHADANGTWLIYAETGDDGYSRMIALYHDGTRRRSLSVRRDTYPMGWSADGERILFIEGNSVQGEPTSLMSVLPDGTGRRTVFPGADR
ncbi:MAG: hypothetical protein C0418_05215 [Coriobacteriaceae bacterium]|nr:hypothetical protein [Coriobacteriaceae bacterium]